jgi:hypothetical protein
LANNGRCRRRTTKTGRLSIHTNQKQIVNNDGRAIAEAKKTAEDVAERLNAEEGRREEDRLVSMTFPTDSAIGVRLPFFLMQNKGRNNGKPTNE